MKTLFDTVDRLESALTFHRERQQVVSANIANLNTPNYKPLDLERVSPEGAIGAGGVGGLAMAKSAPGHLSGGATPSGQGRLVQVATTAGTDGNGIDIGTEMARLDAARVAYTASTEIVSRRLALLRYGAGDGNG